MTNKEWREEFTEKGADIEHNRWAKWQKYFYSKCQIKNLEDGYVYMQLPADLYERWNRQIDQSYSELSETEKESDRKEARTYMPLIQSLLDKQKGEIMQDLIIKFQMEGEYGKLTPFQQTVNTYIKNRGGEIIKRIEEL